MEVDEINTSTIEVVTQPGTFKWLMDVFFCGWISTNRYDDCRSVVEMLRHVAPHWEGCDGLEGLILANERRYIEAVELLTKNLVNFPENYMQKFYLANCMRMIGNPDWIEVAQSVADSRDVTFSSIAKKMLGITDQGSDFSAEAADFALNSWQHTMMRV